MANGGVAALFTMNRDGAPSRASTLIPPVALQKIFESEASPALLNMRSSFKADQESAPIPLTCVAAFLQRSDNPAGIVGSEHAGRNVSRHRADRRDHCAIAYLRARIKVMPPPTYTS